MTNSNYTGVHEALLRDFCDWSREDALAEARRNYDTVRQIPSAVAWRFIEHVDAVSPEEAAVLSRALVLRSQSRSFPVLQRTISAADEAAIQRWLGSGVMALTKPELRLYAKKQAGSLKLVPRKEIGAIAAEILSDLFGRAPERWGGGNYRWNLPVGGYFMHTYLDTGARSRQIAYSHSVTTRDTGLQVIEDTSLFAWTGISGMTTWDFVEEGQIDQFADVFRNIVRRFVVSAVSFLGAVGSTG